MAKFILSALIGVLVLGLIEVSSVAQAAPPSRAPVHCTGANSVWVDIDRTPLNLTVPLGDGDDKISWRARGHTTLDCGLGSPLTGQVAQIQQHVQARVHGGVIAGDAQTSVRVGNRQIVFHGNYTGTTTLNQGTLSFQGDANGHSQVNAADLAVWHVRYQDAGTINLPAKQFTSHTMTGFMID